MKIIDVNGNYQYRSSTRTPSESDHPIHCARIELALGVGEWLYSPGRGHQLRKYSRVDQTESNLESFRKELLLYLEKYSPDVRETLGERGVVEMDMTISKDALNV